MATAPTQHHPALGDLLATKAVGLVSTFIVAAVTALAAFTYSAKTEIALVTQQISQLTTLITKLETRIEILSENYTSKAVVAELEGRVRVLEREMVEVKTKARK